MTITAKTSSLVALTIAAGIFACSDDRNYSDGNNAGTSGEETCTQGVTEICTCKDGAKGTHTCSDGIYWTLCQCNPIGTSGSSGSPDTMDAGKSDPVCGNGLLEAFEQCDGKNLGFGSCWILGQGRGELLCDQESCTYDTSQCEDNSSISYGDESGSGGSGTVGESGSGGDNDKDDAGV